MHRMGYKACENRTKGETNSFFFGDGRVADLEKAVRRFVDTSAAAFSNSCDNISVHVVTDVELAGSSLSRNVQYHRVPATTHVSNVDRRWVLYNTLLERLPEWECAWAVDLTDVSVVRVPPCAPLPQRALWIASDMRQALGSTAGCCGVGSPLALPAAGGTLSGPQSSRARSRRQRAGVRRISTRRCHGRCPWS